MNSHVACKLIGSIALLGFVMAGPAQADVCPIGVLPGSPG